LRHGKKYTLPDNMNSQKLARELSRAFRIKSGDVIETRVEYFDTFDWRLFGQGLIFEKSGESILLKEGKTGRIVGSAKCETDAPKFWWEYKGTLRGKLKTLLDVRALLRIADANIERKRFSILNSDQKTTAYADVCSVTGNKNEDDLNAFVICHPVRGYTSELPLLIQFLETLGLQAVDTILIETVLKGSGRTPGDYSSKIKVELEPGWPAGKGLAVICLTLLDTIRRNEEGIRRDWDTEFLHDFRVGIRRTRSALTQLKNAFDPEITKKFKASFAELGRSTNQLRDLDVYLLKETDYRKLIPGELQNGLIPLFKVLRERREESLGHVKKALASPDYRKMLNEWKKILIRQRKDSAGPGDSVLSIASRTIYNRYRKIMNSGKKINTGTPDEKLHQLRIACKKLRYLLEFFVSVYPAHEISLLINQLKKLQDNLGKFNDLSVQKEQLRSFLEQKDGQTIDVHEAAALGGLITRLDQEHAAVRADFQTRFDQFSQPENQSLFKRLFQQTR